MVPFDYIQYWELLLGMDTLRNQEFLRSGIRNLMKQGAPHFVPTIHSSYEIYNQEIDADNMIEKYLSCWQ